MFAINLSIYTITGKTSQGHGLILNLTTAYDLTTAVIS